MSDPGSNTCPVCGGDHVVTPGESCPTLRAAAAQGAHPRGVPPAVYAGYLEAREALKHAAPAKAASALEQVLAVLASERGAARGSGVELHLELLRAQGAVTPRLLTALSPRVNEPLPERAWALMSIVEHALYRLYLRRP